jgi:hypothetical protein
MARTPSAIGGPVGMVSRYYTLAGFEAAQQSDDCRRPDDPDEFFRRISKYTVIEPAFSMNI